MADRPIWRGHLRLALVSCPVALHTARHDAASLHFHFINPETGNRVRSVTLDAETGDELSRRDLSRGFEYEKDHYVVLDDDDFEKARIESSATITIDKFVSQDAIDPVYYDASYYMVPDGDAGQDVYVVLRDAITRAKRMALSRVVIARRERAIAIMPLDRGLVVHTLHEAKDITDPKPLFANIPALKPAEDMIGLATQLITRQTAAFDPSDMEDRYEARLRKVIDAKLNKKSLRAAPSPKADGKVVDLMAALRSSLGQKPAKAPAKASASKPARKRA